MPGNFPSQQAGAAAKNKPPVAIIIGAVAAVVVIALAAVFFLTNRVSRSDYEEALVQTQALESSYTAINEEFSSAASATDNDSSSAYDEGKKKLKTFKQDSDKLAAMKAVKKDKDVKEKYETFEQDRVKYERYMNDLAQTMPALMKMTHTCTKLPKFDSADMSSYYRDLSKALESCAADAGDLAKVPHQVLCRVWRGYAGKRQQEGHCGSDGRSESQRYRVWVRRLRKASGSSCEDVRHRFADPGSVRFAKGREGGRISAVR
ncbi:MAG: hypothetical protein R2683_02095 [Bifidobacterium adolescentis]